MAKKKQYRVVSHIGKEAYQSLSQEQKINYLQESAEMFCWILTIEGRNFVFNELNKRGKLDSSRIFNAMVEDYKDKNEEYQKWLKQ